jgi:hypothetical protein
MVASPPDPVVSPAASCEPVGPPSSLPAMVEHAPPAAMTRVIATRKRLPFRIVEE